MTRISLFAVALLSWLAAVQPGVSQTPPGQGGIEKLYVLYCGDIALTDASSFTPGASGPGALSVTCYLIKHGRDWVLFDTGLPDAIAAMPAGQPSGAGVWTSKKTL
jgi:N-acyl homoserine lactone hydrolase